MATRGVATGALVATLAFPLSAQKTVVDIHVSERTVAADSQRVTVPTFRVVVPGALVPAVVPGRRPRPGARERDTLTLAAPGDFSVDLKHGDVLLLSDTPHWVWIDVLLADGGTIRAAGRKLRVSLREAGKTIEVRGVP